MSEKSSKSKEDELQNKENFFLLSEKKGLRLIFFRVLIESPSLIISDFNGGSKLIFSLFSSKFQILIVASREELIIYFPSWLIATDETTPVCPLKVNSSLFSSRFQTLIVLSYEELTNTFRLDLMQQK